jgi:hypothetical protein
METTGSFPAFAYLALFAVAFFLSAIRAIRVIRGLSNFLLLSALSERSAVRPYEYSRVVGTDDFGMCSRK